MKRRGFLARMFGTAAAALTAKKAVAAEPVNPDDFSSGGATLSNPGGDVPIAGGNTALPSVGGDVVILPGAGRIVDANYADVPPGLVASVPIPADDKLEGRLNPDGTAEVLVNGKPSGVKCKVQDGRRS